MNALKSPEFEEHKIGSSISLNTVKLLLIIIITLILIIHD